MDALIVASSQCDGAFFQQIEKQKTPFVLIDRRPQGDQTNFVGADDVEIGRVATEHLIEMGCRRIAHIGGPGISTALGRFKGYRLALESHGLQADPQLVVTREHVDEASDVTGYDAMKQLLAIKRPPDGVFCYNDPTAMGAMQAAIEQGIRIPRRPGVDRLGQRALRQVPARAALHHRSTQRRDRRARRPSGAQVDRGQSAAQARDRPGDPGTDRPRIQRAPLI